MSVAVVHHGTIFAMNVESCRRGAALEPSQAAAGRRFTRQSRLTPSRHSPLHIAAPENVPEPSSIASPNLLSLPHRTRPEPELFFIFLISITCWCGPCGVVGDATASSKRSGKSIGLWGKPGLSSQAGIRPADGPIDQHR